jgi:2-C-methyl-D-erythritol 4-phosphate cytidylyltransferase/2-C-methyl-D-erythritol 2,4-cyclodiphosphate synthase
VYSVAVILPAAGSGVRLGAGIPKAFVRVGGRPLICYALDTFLSFDEVRQVLIPVPPKILEDKNLRNEIQSDKRIRLIEGGSERLYSINNALEYVTDVDLIAVHDAVRPFVSVSDIRNVFEAAYRSGAAILGIPSANTLKQIDDNKMIGGTLDRNRVWQALTPQVFKTELLKKAYKTAIEEKRFGTDDASLAEAVGERVELVEGDPGNIKLTYPADLALAELQINKNSTMYRTGTGYDVHQLVEGRKLILGGVEIPFEKGLDGHSDADVLIHAIIDALTGALALGDIGSHFPDDDQRFKDIDSRVLLRRVRELVNENNYEIANIDSTVVAQRPKLSPHIMQMRENIASDLNTDIGKVSVKATTSEKIGFVGREEGMSAMAVVLLKSK